MSGQWLTQSEAATRLGWHVERVKSAARRGHLQRRKNNQGQWLVLITSELATKPGNAGGQVRVEPDHADDNVMTWAIAELREELTEARVAAAHAEGKAEAMSAALSDLRQTLEHERAERAKLAAELAEAHARASKGWLERLLEAVRRRS
jgi:chromosome segregation ATPase